MKGSIKELAGKYQVGNMVLDQPALSVLTRLGEQAGWCKVIETIPSTKGRPTKVWDFSFPFTVTEV